LGVSKDNVQAEEWLRKVTEREWGEKELQQKATALLERITGVVSAPIAGTAEYPAPDT